MIKKEIKYIDYNGNEQTANLYFNLNKLEKVKFAAKYGDLEKHIKELQTKEDAAGIIDLLEDLIMMSYGIKTEDGKFLKNKTLTEDFVETEAYSELFMCLIEDQTGKNAEEFITGVVNSPNDKK